MYVVWGGWWWVSDERTFIVTRRILAVSVRRRFSFILLHSAAPSDSVFRSLCRNSHTYLLTYLQPPPVRRVRCKRFRSRSISDALRLTRTTLVSASLPRSTFMASGSWLLSRLYGISLFWHTSDVDSDTLTHTSEAVAVGWRNFSFRLERGTNFIVMGFILAHFSHVGRKNCKYNRLSAAYHIQ